MIKTLSGDNSYEINQALQSIKSEFIKTHGDFAVEKIDAEDAELDQITAAIQSQPFLASKKLLVLHRPSSLKPFIEKVEELLSSTPENTDIIIVEPNIDKRLAYYKLLKKVTDFKEYTSSNFENLPNWVRVSVKDLGGQISEPDISYLLNRVGSNQNVLSNEISKLILFNPQITRETINQLTETTPQSTVFELLEAAISGKAANAIKIYQEQRWLGEEPLKIMAMIGWQLHVLALIKTAGQGSVEEIAQKTKLHPFVVRKNTSVVNRLTLQQIKNLVSEALKLDIKLKNESIDPDEALQNFLLKF